MALALPDPETADGDGLVYVGGDLDPATVIAAYRRGLFPWRGGAAIPWYSPDPRGVAVAGRVRASHKTRQHARSRGWTVAFDRDFAGAMQRCATTPRAARGQPSGSSALSTGRCPTWRHRPAPCPSCTCLASAGRNCARAETAPICSTR